MLPLLMSFITSGVLTADPARAQSLPRVQPNDMRASAGRMVDGELRIELETVEAEWYPRGANGPRIVRPAFAEAGGPPMVPGPLIRATAGTPIVGVRNRLDRPVSVRGLLDRVAVDVERPPEDAFIPSFAFADSLVVPPGERREVRFTPTVDVSSFYFGSIVQPPGWAANPGYWIGNHGEQGGFVGAFVVDEPDTASPDDRIFLITRWRAREEPSTMGTTFKMMINGTSWPFTERLEYAQGDTVRWRVIKDLPPALRTARPAEQYLGVGETYEEGE